MELLLFLGSVTAVVGGSAFLLYRQARRSALAQVGSLQAVAELVGLTESRTSWAAMPRPEATLVGRSRALRVALSTALKGAADRSGQDGAPLFSKSIAIDGMGLRQGDLEIRRETLGTGLSKALGAREVVLGDPTFDRCVYLRGSEPLVYALFGYETRRLVARLLIGADSVVSLVDGSLQVAIPESVDSPEWLAETVASALEVARRLARPADVASRLAVNAREDPAVALRVGSLAALAREYPGRPATTRALRGALDDPSAEVRFRAAMALGPDGHETLLAIASAEDGQQEAASAIEALGEHLPRERAEMILGQALRTRRLPVARACLEALGARGGTECVKTLSRVLAVEQGELADAAARALGATRSPEAEAPLVSALDHRDHAVIQAAAVALGSCGTAAAVAPLRRIESGPRDAACRRTARQAVAQIQSRLTGADPGQLSLAGDESGQLSLIEDEAGRVALLEDDDDATSGESGSGSQI